MNTNELGKEKEERLCVLDRKDMPRYRSKRAWHS